MKLFEVVAFAALLVGVSAAPKAEPNWGKQANCLPGQIYYKRNWGWGNTQQCRCPFPGQYYDYSKYQCVYPQPPPVYTTPAYTPPAYTTPAYTPPAYTTPAYTPPAYTTPAYTPPAYTTPAYTPPAYTTPAATTPAYTPPACQPQY